LERAAMERERRAIIDQEAGRRIEEESRMILEQSPVRGENQR